MLQDKPDRQSDFFFAKHVTDVHAHSKQQSTEDPKFLPITTLRRYIKLCKRKNPVIDNMSREYIINAYVELRENARSRPSHDAIFTSPRDLLSIIRLSMAMARLRLSDTVEKCDVSEVLRLLTMSKPDNHFY